MFPRLFPDRVAPFSTAILFLFHFYFRKVQSYFFNIASILQRVFNENLHFYKNEIKLKGIMIHNPSSQLTLPEGCT